MKEAVAHVRRESKADPGSEIRVLGRPKCTRDAWIQRNNQTQRCSGKSQRLLPWDHCLEFVLGIVPGCSNFPTQAVIDGQIPSRPPAILAINAVVLAPRVQKLLAGLHKRV